MKAVPELFQDISDREELDVVPGRQIYIKCTDRQPVKPKHPTISRPAFDVGVVEVVDKPLEPLRGTK